MNSDNPLLAHHDDPIDYAVVRIEHVRAAIDQLIADTRIAINTIIDHQRRLPTWDGLVLAIDALDARLNNTLNSIVPLGFRAEGEWQKITFECWDRVQAFFREKLQNVELLHLYERFAASAHGRNLDWHGKAALHRTLTAFRLSGVHLPAHQRARLQALEQQVSSLNEAFFINMSRSSDNWSLHIMDEQRLHGIPALNKAAMAAAATTKGLGGWLITLEEAPYLAVIEHAQDRALREQLYRAYLTRGASADPQYDNAGVLQALAETKQEKARLLGFASFPQFNLQLKGGASPEQVVTFLEDLARQAGPGLERERQQLQAAAQQQGLVQPQPWDVVYLRKQMGHTPLSVSEDDLRAFFPLPAIVSALIDLARNLFGLVLTPASDISIWEPGVLAFEAVQDHALLGYLYIDAIARDGKPSEAAWTSYLRNRHTDADGIYHTSAAALFTSIAPGQGSAPPLLTHLDLRKLFHEFGHGLHHLLVRTANYHLSDIQKLGPGGFEIASKLLERWCWSASYLASISTHFERGTSLSVHTLQAVLDRYQAQERPKLAVELAKSLFDLDLHGSPDDGRAVQQRVEDSFGKAGAWPLAAFERPMHAFDHLVTGYDVGYYGYLWADVHAFDLFSRFEQEGLKNRATGLALQDEVFAPGAARPIRTGVEAFLNRPLSALPFLRWYGLAD
ncbi:M3 family metallopeptidase [Pseudomonas sp. BJa5]|uniref:M3 family metallopeptidase n=1 Tax=Pseudomonas sp. BJa5 TaxID=2936270 RepID=UPI002559A31B|nr:M3 family metallopeptidase [Pseudomonas sp. BGr12]MDL2423142.1 M3 family metallopeptidase [Pseudomonas sp. BGr12]